MRNFKKRQRRGRAPALQFAHRHQPEAPVLKLHVSIFLNPKRKRGKT